MNLPRTAKYYFNSIIRIYIAFTLYYVLKVAGSAVVKNLPVSAGDTDLIPGLGYLLQEEMTNHSSILAGKLLWTEEPRGLESMGSQRGRHD